MRQPRLQLTTEALVEECSRPNTGHMDQLPGDNYDGFYEVGGLLLTSLGWNIELSSL